ncbi:flagellar biosynthesis protein FliQ [Paraclostridium sordellii]|uniref:Flagellar biosynthetic protein FliQ n=1 Tax=Paraclostridium sordellii TaxID=1505 RepID=A0A0C7PCW1_PARSO|nr:flagellar biosynthesis protein FliQ [Paeniclostridium sordellii]MCR1849836.1 flagellar biosynthesis protein FliQ [Paeniclostridium sordellii]QYE97271.1 flagellar biosynthesis protein FliQ [Paeniclostridium sordellii]CEN21622.1 flagellar biosynthetic protein FliQ [[Clostridium] sordellii] [Paeniclostridium sordellii]CEN25022.1 flagellar biosynthetic protein FliQ [[Clostridium] sordellii] [Paeniclostridium sordellii]CEN79285.1 flagellar biosynthetic protein FliQ [[Clostridium] sordellii] [Pae
MNESVVVSVVKETLYTAMLVGGPILIISLIVGLIVSIFQATTQIQEQTLSFIPKLITIALVLVVGGAWMLDELIQFTNKIMNMIAVIKG